MIGALYSGPILDTHQHLWDLERFNLPWLPGAPHLNRSYLPEAYLRVIENTGIVRSIYMEVDLAPEQQQDEAAYAGALCRRPDYPVSAAVLSARPAAPRLEDHLDRLAERCPVAGIREVLHGGRTPRGYCLSSEFVRGIRLLGQRGLSFDLCLRQTEVQDAAELCRLCPETAFMLDHCGNPDVAAGLSESWQRNIDSVASAPNAFCKISGLVVSARAEWGPEDLAPFIRHVLESFGPDRVVFGSDWPVCTRRASPAQWVEALKQILAPYPAAQQEALFWKNGHAFYGLLPAE